VFTDEEIAELNGVHKRFEDRKPYVAQLTDPVAKLLKLKNMEESIGGRNF